MNASFIRSLPRVISIHQALKAKISLRSRSLLLLSMSLCLVLTGSICRADGISTLYTFSPAVINASGTYVNSDGWGPNGLIAGGDGYYYGTTFSGGANANGVIFQVSTTGSMKTLHTFSAFTNLQNSDGAHPVARLTLGKDNTFYGVTTAGGTNGSGVIYSITPDGTFAVIYTFSALDTKGINQEGATPYGALVLGSDGNLYGTASAGGPNGSGTIFQFALNGDKSIHVLHAFTAVDSNDLNQDGAQPISGLVQGSDDTLYGMTYIGGANATGTIFSQTIPGTFTLLHTFEGYNFYFGNRDGAQPTADLIQAKDGDLYGTTTYGGIFSFGTAFKISTGGSYSLLHYFTGPNSKLENKDGESPIAPLFQASNGSLYGTAALGGGRKSGTIYTVTGDGELTTLYDFGVRDANNKNLDGISPNSLVEGDNGYLFGSTYTGGAGRSGTIFRLGAVIDSLTPGSVPADTAFTLTVNGSGFYSDDIIYWNQVKIPTTFVSSTQLTASVSTLNDHTWNQYPYSVPISVVSRSGFTVQSILTITEPAPQLAQIVPASLASGQKNDVRLVLAGKDFAPGATVNWNGAALVSKYHGQNRLSVVVPKVLFASPTTVTVSVTNPGTGGTSNSITFTITP